MVYYVYTYICIHHFIKFLKASPIIWSFLGFHRSPALQCEVFKPQAFEGWMQPLIGAMMDIFIKCLRFFEATRPPMLDLDCHDWSKDQWCLGFENVRPLMFKCFTLFAKHLRMLISQARSVWGVSILSKVLAGNVRLGVYGRPRHQKEHIRSTYWMFGTGCQTSLIGFLLPTHHLGNTPIAKTFPRCKWKSTCKRNRCRFCAMDALGGKLMKPDIHPFPTMKTR